MNNKGFTLIELIVVIAIIAILAAVAVPSYLSVQQNARVQVDRGNAGIIVSAINTHNTLVDAGIAGVNADVPAISGIADVTAFNTACDVDLTMSATEFTAAKAYIVYTTAGTVATVTATGSTPAPSSGS